MRVGEGRLYLRGNFRNIAVCFLPLSLIHFHFNSSYLTKTRIANFPDQPTRSSIETTSSINNEVRHLCSQLLGRGLHRHSRRRESHRSRGTRPRGKDILRMPGGQAFSTMLNAFHSRNDASPTAPPAMPLARTVAPGRVLGGGRSRASVLRDRWSIHVLPPTLELCN